MIESLDKVQPGVRAGNWFQRDRKQYHKPLVGQWHQ